ncbi:MAG: hypothetical protein ABSG74_04255 [Candidatus Bathyarchaeia archaeon]
MTVRLVVVKAAVVQVVDVEGTNVVPLVRVCEYVVIVVEVVVGETIVVVCHTILERQVVPEVVVVVDVAFVVML